MFKRLGCALVAVLTVWVTPLFAQTAEFNNSFRWSEDPSNFGGFSSIHVFDNGIDFYAITDKGHITKSKFQRSSDGQIRGIEFGNLVELKNDKGEPLTRFQIDAEGIAVRDNGRIYVSFEAIHRVWTYSSPTSEAAWMPRHPDFKEMQNNSSLEALAIDQQNRLYTVPERSGLLTRPFPVYRYENGKWTIPFSFPRRGEFLVAGLDVGPDNRIYLLERHFTGWSFTTRIRRFDLDGQNEKTILTTSAGAHDNLEGISVWKNPNGQLIATLISDDNFRFLQRTEIVEYLLPD